MVTSNKRVVERNVRKETFFNVIQGMEVTYYL